MRTIWLRVLLVGVLLGSLAGLHPVEGAARPVFAVVPKAINNPFFNQVRDGCMEAAKRLNVTCEFTGPEQTEIAPQIRVLEALVARKVSGLAISPVDGKSVVPVIKKAMAGGIPVITFDSDAAPESGRLAFVGTDNEAAGKELGRLFLRFAPNGATYGIITGGLGAVNLNQRIKGFKSVVTDTSKYREVSGSPFPSNDDINRAVQLVEQMITANPNLTAIVMVGGWPLFAPEAYKNAVKKKEADIKAGRFTVVSFDTLEPELRLVKEGFVSGLVGQRPYQMGVRSIELLNDIVVKKMKPAQTFYNTGVDIVTRENVDRFLQK
ncbi:MAG: sugar-binding protein [Armatimonadota bacterium]|nr:sugar-binding protein [Armatimonadota bacterium]MDR7449715.1 sugar-binding protein [Armatimonadota bacterium]MDR7458369.1 sugar-binding protein [Armatimonadota bacterium]MDR7478827.1 sugar-binding protein [Armatimonadota bacterium]MDR7490644.1 sugar-binding protein [Armatimonadota bacterium]